jgi:hypothetical protein
MMGGSIVELMRACMGIQVSAAAAAMVGGQRKDLIFTTQSLSFEIHTQSGPQKTSFQLFFFLCTLPILNGLLALESRSKASFDRDPCYASLENWIKLLTSRDLSLCVCLSSYGRQHARSREHREH